MTRYLFVYHGGGPMPTDKAEIDAVMEKWRLGVGSLGDALIEPGNPGGKSSKVSATASRMTADQIPWQAIPSSRPAIWTPHWLRQRPAR